MISSLESAFIHVEKQMQLRLCVHDLCGELWKYLVLTRFQHRHPLCRQVKQSSAEPSCVQLEITEFRAVAHRWKEGRFHRCHAGFSEVVMPVYEDGALLAVLFAGPFQVAESVIHEYQQDASLQLPVLDQGTLRLLDQQDVEMLRESLKMLAARTRCWLWDQQWGQEYEVSRSELIERYIHDHYARPLRVADIADVLCVSEDRARHIIKESLGVSFSQALKQARMKAACALLLNTDLSVAEIGEACGIADASCFTRFFRELHGSTAHQWRKQHRGS